jgi:abortive infection bacteriophage resistance protein
MSKKNYNKPPLTYNEQITRLKERGLIIQDEEKALHLLQQLSYYRLSGYWHTLLKEPKSDHHFKENSTFEQSFKLYCFDRELRLLVLNQIEKIEVAVRAIITYECSHSWDSFWLSNNTNFKNDNTYQKNIKKIEAELNRSNELFLKEYKNKYLEKLPPSWITLEVCSFGSLSWIFSILKNGRTKKTIASKFGLNEKVFGSWLHSIVYLRNVCAHHSRLWNKSFSIKAELPKKIRYDWITQMEVVDTRNGSTRSIKDKTYFSLCILQYLLQIINPNNTFKQKIEELFIKYPEIDRAAMGYPIHWEDDALWNK